MAISYICPKCNSTFSIKHKKCPKCGTPVPKRGKTYYVRVMVYGRRVCKAVPNSLELARQIESKIKTELIEGLYFNRRKQLVFSTFMEEKYFPWAKENKPASYERELSIYKLWIKPVIGKKHLQNITPFDLEKIKNNLKRKNRAPRTIEYTLGVIRRAFNLAMLWDLYFGSNPVSKVKIEKTDNRRIRFLSEEEASLLLDTCKKHSQQLYEICLLALFCGLRAGEIFNLTWQDINLKEKIIYIRDPKNRNNRVAYMTKDIEEMFSRKKRGKPNELVFKDRNGRKIKAISKTFHKIAQQLFNEGISDPRHKVVFHTLRHTFASWLVKNGTPIYVVKELMGHKTLVMTERYSHLANSRLREAIKELPKLN